MATRTWEDPWGRFPLTNQVLASSFGEWETSCGSPLPWDSGTLWKLPFFKLVSEGGKLIVDLCSLTPDALWDWGDPIPAIRELHSSNPRARIPPRAPV